MMHTRAFPSIGIGALVFGVALTAASGCTAGTASTTSDGGLTEGGPPESGVSDGPVVLDASIDAATGDGSVACGLMGGTYSKTCTVVGDCTTVARGCYCGAQPVIGIAKSASASASACETKAANDCALGCPNFPGRVAEDGKNDDDGGTIEVRCDNGQCHTILVQ